MTVLHVTHSLALGGGPEHIWKLIEGVQECRHFVAGCPGPYRARFVARLGRERVVALNGRHPLRNCLRVRRTVRRVRPDLVHAHGRAGALYAFLLLPRAYRKRTLYTIHGFFPDTLERAISRAYLLMERLFYRRVSCYIHVSDSERRSFESRVPFLVCRSWKHLTIPNGVELLEDGQYIAPDQAAEAGLPFDGSRRAGDARLRIVSISRLFPQKGLDLLIRSAARVPEEVTLYIVGQGPEEDRLRALARRCGVQDKVAFLGPIPNARLLLRCFHAFVTTSRVEGMPISLLEAMDAEIPIVAVPSLGITDVVDVETCYMSASRDPRDIAAVVRQYARDRTAAADVVARKVALAKNRLRDRFSVEQMNASVAGAYREVLRRSPR